MDDKEKKLKKAGTITINAILVAVILRVSLYTTVQTLAARIQSVISIVALTFGVFYALKGYKKNAAKNYKGFMLLYFVNGLLSIVAPLSIEMSTNSFRLVSGVTLAGNIVIVICACILALGKDLGKNKSLTLSYAILGCNLIKLVAIILDLEKNPNIVDTKTLAYAIVAYVSNLLLAAILVIFVDGKYMDKEARGREV